MTAELQTRWHAFRDLINKLPEVPEEESNTRTSEESTFHEFCRAIQNPEAIVTTRKFLETLGTPINPRLMLSGFMIATFPHQLLHEHNMHLDDTSQPDAEQSDDRKLDDICYEHATKLVESVVNKEEITSEYTNELRSVLATFKTTFEEWKNHDMKKMVKLLKQNYSKYYRSLRFVTSIGSEDTQKMLDAELKHSLATTKVEMIRLIGQKEFNAFEAELVAQADEEAKSELENQEASASQTQSSEQSGGQDADDAKEPIQINLSELIVEEGAKAYWMEFAAELDKDDYSRVIKLIEEISERIKKLTPNRADHHARLDQELNIELLKQMIHFKAMDSQAFYRIFNTIWTWIRSLHAAADDKEWDQWRDDQFGRFGQPECKWSDMLPPVFNRFLMKLDRIEEVVEKLADRLEQQQADGAAAETQPEANSN